jgi:hypothetical protein
MLINLIAAAMHPNQVNGSGDLVTRTQLMTNRVEQLSQRAPWVWGLRDWEKQAYPELFDYDYDEDFTEE